MTPEERKGMILQYSRDYFDGGPDTPGYSEYTDTWFWSPITEIMLHLLGPLSVLDWGCAKGFLVQRFVDRGVSACGVDVSHYAISQAPEWFRKHRLRVINGIQSHYGPGIFTAICSFETMEHIPEEDIPAVLGEMKRISTRWWFGSIFLDCQEGHDPTHVTVRSREWWNEKFKAAGYQVREDIVAVAQEYPVFRTLGVQLFCYEKIT